MCFKMVYWLAFCHLGLKKYIFIFFVLIDKRGKNVIFYSTY